MLMHGLENLKFNGRKLNAPDIYRAVFSNVLTITMPCRIYWSKYIIFNYDVRG
jgi:hypothetical protein